MNQTTRGHPKDNANSISPHRIHSGQHVICWFPFVDLKLFSSLARRPTVLTEQWEQRSHVSFISDMTTASPKGWVPHLMAKEPRSTRNSLYH